MQGQHQVGGSATNVSCGTSAPRRGRRARALPPLGSGIWHGYGGCAHTSAPEAGTVPPTPTTRRLPSLDHTHNPWAFAGVPLTRANPKNTISARCELSDAVLSGHAGLVGACWGDSVQGFFRRVTFHTGNIPHRSQKIKGKIPHLPNLECIGSRGEPGIAKFWQITSGSKHRISVPENLQSIPTSLRFAADETPPHISPLI